MKRLPLYQMPFSGAKVVVFLTYRMICPSMRNLCTEAILLFQKLILHCSIIPVSLYLINKHFCLSEN